MKEVANTQRCDLGKLSGEMFLNAEVLGTGGPIPTAVEISTVQNRPSGGRDNSPSYTVRYST